METLGQVIYRLRNNKNPRLTAIEFGKKIGVTRGHVSSIEKDKRLPSQELFDRISIILDNDLKLISLYNYHRQSNKPFNEIVKEVRNLKEENFLFAQILEAFLEKNSKELQTFIHQVIDSYTSSPSNVLDINKDLICVADLKIKFDKLNSEISDILKGLSNKLINKSKKKSIA